MPDGPLLGVFLIVPYALLANLFYAGGWVTELLILAGGIKGGARLSKP